MILFVECNDDAAAADDDDNGADNMNYDCDG